MRIVFIGPPGAGKGTQCRRLSEALQIPHISSGEMLRASKGNTEIGQLIASFIDHGNLVPDDVVMRFIVDRLKAPDCDDGYLFDGFPRTVSQAEDFDQYLGRHDQRLDAVIELVANESELVSRLLRRAETENRADDTIDTITSRLVVFRERTAPVLQYYGRQEIVHQVDAMCSVDEVFESIRSLVAGL